MNAVVEPPSNFCLSKDFCAAGEHVVVVVRQIGDCAGAGYLLQMALQKTKKMLGVIDASVRIQHCTCSLLVKVCIQENVRRPYFLD